MDEVKGYWKVLAIIFIIIFILENAFFVWAYLSVVQEEKQTNYCYYDVCEDYPQAYYLDKLCTCYEYDLIGNLQVAKQKYLG